jgi:hypothetical protein
MPLSFGSFVLKSIDQERLEAYLGVAVEKDQEYWAPIKSHSITVRSHLEKHLNQARRRRLSRFQRWILEKTRHDSRFLHPFGPKLTNETNNWKTFMS